jgi:hypothetical protein
MLLKHLPFVVYAPLSSIELPHTALQQQVKLQQPGGEPLLAPPLFHCHISDLES